MAGSPAGVPGIPLLTTKLFVPTARSDLVVRPRLLERLTDGAGARFTLLTAQAGAGKTTLLAAWLASRGSPVAWLSLDERDQDAHRFVRYVIAAFQTIAPGCGATALAWLEGSPSPVELVLTSLLNDVAALPRRTMLVLDDYHLVRSRAVHDALGFLLDHLPPAAQLVISTREDPPLALPRHPERGHDRAAARCHGRAARRGRRARAGHRTRCGPGGGRVGGREPGTGRPRLPRGRGGRPRPVRARQGRPEQADEAIATVTAAARSAGVPQAALVASAHLVAVRRLRGAHRAALHTVRSALAWAEGQASTAAPAAAMLSAQLAELLLDRNELAAARSAAEHALATLRHFPHMQPPNLLSRLVTAKVLVATGDAGAALEVVAEARSATPSSAGVGLLISAAEASTLMALGDPAAAARWAAAVDLPELRSFGLQTHRLAALMDAVWVTPARILVAHGRSTGDEAVLRAAAWRVAEVGRRTRGLGLGALEGTTLLLEALVAAALGDSGAALEALDAAVARCVPEGVVRPFVDAGGPMTALLATAREGVADGSEAAGRLDVLLTACKGAAPPARPPRNGMIETLTLREQEVLRLLADGRSNAEIARTLVVEQSTVKTHLVHVYRKLEVRSRTQALAKARDLRLVD